MFLMNLAEIGNKTLMAGPEPWLGVGGKAFALTASHSSSWLTLQSALLEALLQ